MTATPLREMQKSQLDALALTAGEEITVSMKLDQYHAIQRAIAEGNFTRGQTEGQRELIAYLYHIIVTKELTFKALEWGRMPGSARDMFQAIMQKIGGSDETPVPKV